MKRSEQQLESLKEWWHSVFPYVERGLSGAPLRRNLLAALAVWLLSALAASFIVYSGSSLARDWRHSLDLESSEREAINWPQCGFCVTVLDPTHLEELEEEMRKSPLQQRHECANFGYRTEACEGLPHELRSALRRLERPAQAEDQKYDWRHNPLFVQPSAEGAWEIARSQDFLPSVEPYRSPLAGGDFARVWGLVAALFLLPLLVIVWPLRMVMRVGTTLYHQSWSLLVATQQPVERILAGVLLQAALPLFFVAAPLVATVMVQMLVVQGALGSALGFGLAALSLAALWSAFAVTLSVLAGRRVAPALLVVISVFVGALYIIALLAIGDSLIRGGRVAAIFLRSGADLWLLARANFLSPELSIVKHGYLRVEWVAASVLLFAACLRWITAHARRLQAQVEPALSRRGWYGGWAMAGAILTLRVHASNQRLRWSEDLACAGYSRESFFLYLLVLTVPLASYLRHAVHPHAHRSELRLDRGSWWRAFKESWGAIGIMLALSYSLDLCGWSRALAFLSSSMLLPFFLFSTTWVALATGLSLLLARGIRSRREKLIFALAAVGTFIAVLVMLNSWFNQRGASPVEGWYALPGWALAALLVSAGPVLLLHAREFGRAGHPKKVGA